VLKAIESRSVADRLGAVSAEAARRPVREVPAIAVSGEVLDGSAAVATAAATFVASS